MDKIIESAKELSTSIKELPEVQEYLKLKNLFEKDENLAQMRRDIAYLESEGKLEEKKNLLEVYNSHPLVSNYYSAKEEVRNILETIKEILSD